VAVAERVLEFVESNWRRVRDVGATLNDLSRLEGSCPAPRRPPMQDGAPKRCATWGASPRPAIWPTARGAPSPEWGRQERGSLPASPGAHPRDTVDFLGPRSRIAGPGQFTQLGEGAGRAECELVLGEIDYFQGNHAAARDWLKQAARHFSTLPDALGHGRCLVLLGLTDLAAGKFLRGARC